MPKGMVYHCRTLSPIPVTEINNEGGESMAVHTPLADLTMSLRRLDEIAAQQAREAIIRASPSAGAGRRTLRHAEKQTRKTATALRRGGSLAEANALLRLTTDICR